MPRADARAPALGVGATAVETSVTSASGTPARTASGCRKTVLGKSSSRSAAAPAPIMPRKPSGNVNAMTIGNNLRALAMRVEAPAEREVRCGPAACRDPRAHVERARRPPDGRRPRGLDGASTPTRTVRMG